MLGCMHSCPGSASVSISSWDARSAARMIQNEQQLLGGCPASVTQLPGIMAAIAGCESKGGRGGGSQLCMTNLAVRVHYVDARILSPVLTECFLYPFGAVGMSLQQDVLSGTDMPDGMTLAYGSAELWHEESS